MTPTHAVFLWSHDHDNIVQEAQLWERLDTFSINISVIRKIMHKIVGSPYGGHQGQRDLSESFNAKKLCIAEFHRQNVSFTRKTAN